MGLRRVKQEDGQTLIYFALAVAVLLLILIFAIDTGFLFGEKRRMQNAADAGALAGANTLCAGAGAAEAKRVAEYYAVARNLAPAALATVTETGTAAGTVSVYASETVDSMYAAFASGVGGSAVADPTVGARATARCGVACRACNIWPIAFQQVDWDRIDNCLPGENRPGLTYFLTDVAIDTGITNLCDCYDCAAVPIVRDSLATEPVARMVPVGKSWLNFYPGMLDPSVDPCAVSGNSNAAVVNHLNGYNNDGAACSSCVDVGCTNADVEGERQDNYREAATHVDPVTLAIVDPSKSCASGPYISGFACARVKWPDTLSGEQPRNYVAVPKRRDAREACGSAPPHAYGFIMEVLCSGTPGCFDPRGRACSGPGGEGTIKAVSLSE